MESEALIASALAAVDDSEAQDNAFSSHIADENSGATQDAHLTSASYISPAVLSTLLNSREPSFLDTQVWQTKSSSQLQQSPARSKKALLPSISSPPRHVLAPTSAAALARFKLSLGGEDGMFDPVRRYNEIAQRMKASISRALARPIPSPRAIKPLSKLSPPPPGGKDTKQKLWVALPAVPRLLADLQRAAGGMGRGADIGASHWLAWCSDQEALGRVPSVTRAVGQEVLVEAGCHGSFKLSLEQFAQCVLLLAARVQETESTPAPPPPSASEPIPQPVQPSSPRAESDLLPQPPLVPAAPPVHASAPKPRARACSSQYVALTKSLLKRLATAVPPSPPVHERSRRSCKSSAWFGKLPAIDKLYTELGSAPFTRATFVSAVVAAFGDAGAGLDDVLGAAFDWAGAGQVSDDQVTLDYDGLWQAALYACGFCNSSSVPSIRCSSSALRAVHVWCSDWTFASQQCPPPRTAALPNITRSITTSPGIPKCKSTLAAVSNYASILVGVDPNSAEKSNAEREEPENDPVHSVSFAAQPPPTAHLNLSPTRLVASRGDRGAALESRAGSRPATRQTELPRPVTGIGGFSLPTVNERLRTSPIRQHGTSTLVSGIVASPGPNPLLMHPQPDLDKSFSGRCNQAKFTFQPEFSSQRVFGHFVNRPVVLGPVPRTLLNIPATAEPSFVLQASPPRRYPEGKNINPQWAKKLDPQSLFDESLKGHEV